MKKIKTRGGVEGNFYTVNSNELIWRPSAYGILIKNNKILVSPQWDGYDLPGGGVDIDETIDEAVVREVWEETGLKVEVVEVVHAQTTFFSPDHSKNHAGEHWNCPLVYFLVKQIGGELSTANFDDEEQEYAKMAEWLPLEQINSTKFINSIDTPMVVSKAMKFIDKYDL